MNMYCFSNEKKIKSCSVKKNPQNLLLLQELFQIALNCHNLIWCLLLLWAPAALIPCPCWLLIYLASLISTFIFFCLLKIDLVPVSTFLWSAGTMLSLISRGRKRDTTGETFCFLVLVPLLTGSPLAPNFYRPRWTAACPAASSFLTLSFWEVL